MRRHIIAGVLAAVLACVSGPGLPGRLVLATHSRSEVVTSHSARAIAEVPEHPERASPSIARISLSDISASTAPQDLTVEGAQFVPALLAIVTDPAGHLHALGNSAIEHVESATFQFSMVLDMAGDYSLVVVNPDGRLSNACSFTVGTSPTIEAPAGPPATNGR